MRTIFYPSAKQYPQMMRTIAVFWPLLISLVRATVPYGMVRPLLLHYRAQRLRQFLP